MNDEEYEESLRNIKKYRTNAKKIISNITGIEYDDSELIDDESVIKKTEIDKDKNLILVNSIKKFKLEFSL